MVIYLSRGIIAIINEHISLLPNLSDVSFYHQLGLDYSRELLIQGGGIGASAFGNFFIGILYLVIGSSPVVISVLNAFIYSLTIIILIKICSELNFNNYWIVAFAACILPSSILYIPVLLRESIFLLCATTFFLAQTTHGFPKIPEQEGADNLKAFGKTFSTLEEWQARAKLNREGILKGAGLVPLPKRTPLNVYSHSLKKMENGSSSN